MEYSIEKHKHIFAAWAASIAASVTNYRFKVEEGKQILEASGFTPENLNLSLLPEADEFDEWHREKRYTVVEKSGGKKFTHGVAAKLINIYMKSAYICAENVDDSKIRAIHPPIDSVLLKELIRKDVGEKRDEWKRAQNIKWSKFESDDYEALILAIKRLPNMKEKGLWRIEEYWQGFRLP